MAKVFQQEHFNDYKGSCKLQQSPGRTYNVFSSVIE